MTMPLEVQPIADRVYTELRARILDGNLEHGQRLHQEAVSAALGVSRTPVREALGRLAAEGLVQLLPQRGARVAPLRPPDIRSAYEARLVIEPGAAALAARRGLTPPLRRRLHGAIAAHRAAAGDIQRSFSANRDFHLGLVEASGNQLLLQFAEHLWVARIGATIYERQAETVERMLLDADEHEAILDAVERGDARKAESLSRRHVADALRRLDSV
jgi:DNA-binding GntR family transcriptional regulator